MIRLRLNFPGASSKSNGIEANLFSGGVDAEDITDKNFNFLDNFVNESFGIEFGSLFDFYEYLAMKE